MSEHSPAPWVGDDNEGYSPWTIWSRMGPHGNGKAGAFIATVHGDSSEGDANASLIAAAPELLESLKVMTAAYKSNCPDHVNADWFDDYNAAVAAIKKATGEHP